MPFNKKMVTERVNRELAKEKGFRESHKGDIHALVNKHGEDRKNLAESSLVGNFNKTTSHKTDRKLGKPVPVSAPYKLSNAPDWVLEKLGLDEMLAKRRKVEDTDDFRTYIL